MREADLADAMAERGLVPPDTSPPPLGAAGRPWYVSAVLGGAGWLASLFAFLFVAVLFEPNTAGEFGLAGVVLLASGFGLYIADRESAFFEQLALATTLAGEIALLAAVGEATDSATAVVAFATVMQVALVLALPNDFVRMLSSLFACIAWTLTVRIGWWGEDWFDSRGQQVAFLPALMGWLLIWTPVVVGVHLLVGHEARWMASNARRVLRPVLTGLLAALALATWAAEPFAAFTMWTRSGEVPTNWLVLWPLLGIGTALFAAMSAFRLRHQALIGVGIAGALLHLGHFYFLLGVPLVVKSYIMLVVGAVLLVAAHRAARRAA